MNSSVCAVQTIRHWTANDGCYTTTKDQIIQLVDSEAPNVMPPSPLLIECGESVDPIVTGRAVGRDRCQGLIPDASVTYNDTNSATMCGNTKNITRVWSATDHCGLIGSATQMLYVRDNTPPTIFLPPDVEIECGLDTSTTSLGVAAAADACLLSSRTNSDVVQLTCGVDSNAMIISRTWNATDACGLVTLATQQIRVLDRLPPTFDVSNSSFFDMTVVCSSNYSVAAIGMPSATDQCGNSTVTLFSEQRLPSLCPTLFTLTRTFRAVDPCGRTSSVVQTIRLRDTQLPQLTVPSNSTIPCGASTVPPASGVAIASDDCSQPTVTWFDVPRVYGARPYIIERQWTATDSCRNSRTATQYLNVADTDPPTLLIPRDVTLTSCSVSLTPSINNAVGIASATDTCDTPVLTYSDESIPLGGMPAGCQSRTIRRTWMARDLAGNQVNNTQVIQIVDIDAPSIMLPSTSVSVQCPSTADAAAIGSVATAIDACNSTVSLTYSDVTSVSLRCVAESQITRTWLAADACGNNATRIQMIQVIDTLSPVWNTTAPFFTTAAVFECTPAPGALLPNVTGQPPPPLDQCSGSNVSVSYSDFSTPSCGLTATIRRTWVARDLCGLYSSATQTIIVRDTVAPALQTPSDVLGLECPNAASTSSTGMANATDDCSSVVRVLSSDAINYTCSGGGSGSSTARSIVRTWLAIDQCGNQNQSMQHIVVHDTQAPMFLPLSNATLECSSSGGATIPAPGSSLVATARATDACDTSPRLAHSDQVHTVFCGNAQRVLRVWNATDSCGNVATRVQQIDWLDRMPPLLRLPVSLSTVECTAATMLDPIAVALTGGNATATDLCDAAPLVTFQDTVTRITCGRARQIERVWTATDQCGFSASATQYITVRDTKAPVLSVPAAIQLECGSSLSINATGGNANATDDCDANPTLSAYVDDVVYGCGLSGVVRRQWTARDACGLSITGTQSISIRDTTPPSWTVFPANSTIECSGSSGAPPPDTAQTAQASDACTASGRVQVSYSDQFTRSCATSGTVLRVWRAVDACGKSTTRAQQISVVDSKPPSLQLPANRTIECHAPSFPTTTGTASASDDCGTVRVTYLDTALAGACGGTRRFLRTWSAVDTCGLVSNATQEINEIDTTRPTWARFPRDVEHIECTANVSAIDVYGIAVASDTCGSTNVTLHDVVTRTDSSTGCYAASIARTFTATDQCGNSLSNTQHLLLRDTAAPTWSTALNSTIVLECGSTAAVNLANSSSALQLTNISATDACSATGAIGITDTVATSCGASSTIYRVWSVADACGNSAQQRQTIRLVDTTAPSITLANGTYVTVECNGTALLQMANLLPSATVFDACARGTIQPTSSVQSTSQCGWSGLVAITWVATDQCGLQTRVVQYLNVTDSTPPSIDFADNIKHINLTCTNDTSPGALPTVTVHDACSGTGSVGGRASLTWSDQVLAGTCAAEFQIIRTWHATDACGLVTNETQVIRVSESATLASQASPMLLAPSNVTSECDRMANLTTLETANLPLLGLPTIARNPCDARSDAQLTAALVHSDAVVAYDCANVTGTVRRVWQLASQCNTLFEATQWITIVDRTAPQWRSGDLNVQLECSATVTLPLIAAHSNVSDALAPLAVDQCSSAVHMTVSNWSTTTTSTPSSSNVGQVSRNVTATDDCGLSRQALQVVRVVDTLAPLVSVLNSNMTFECLGAGAPYGTSAVATDACDAPMWLQLTFSDTALEPVTACVSRLVRTWTAVDRASNVGTAMQVITVNDTLPPNLIVNNVQLECSGSQSLEPSTLPASSTPIATDQCSNDQHVVLRYTDVERQSLSSPLCGTLIIRSWSATDQCGNTMLRNQSITVLDSTAPVFAANVSALADVSLACSEFEFFATPHERNDLIGIVASDSCSDVGMSVSVRDTTTLGTLGAGVGVACRATTESFQVSRTWAAVDACGNTAYHLQTLTILPVSAMSSTTTTGTVAPPPVLGTAPETMTDSMQSATTNNTSQMNVPQPGVSATPNAQCESSGLSPVQQLTYVI
jgi:hypothetical protein